MLASMPKCTIAFIVRGTKGAKDARCSAMRRASGSSSPRSTNRVTKPMAKARSASMGSPMSSISSAQPRPTTRGNRAVAPPPGMMPSLPSGVAKREVGVAMRKSQPSATSRPPPMQMPSIAAMVGLGVRSNCSARPCTIGVKALRRSRRSTSDKSEPDAKARPPAPVMVTTFTDSSAAAEATASLSSRRVSKEMALCFSGLSMVTSAIGPSTS